MHGFQIWVNLPARAKMTAPHYQEIPRAGIPEGAAPDGLASVHVIAGEALGATAVIETRTPIGFLHWIFTQGASVDLTGARIRVLAGHAYGQTSPVATLSPLFYADVALPAGGELPLPSEHAERAAYVVDGAVCCGEERAERGRMLVFAPGAEVVLRAVTDARIALIGGAPIEGERHIWWNFVSSSKARIEQAKRDWKDDRFPKVPGDEAESIPLPQ